MRAVQAQPCSYAGWPRVPAGHRQEEAPEECRRRLPWTHRADHRDSACMAVDPAGPSTGCSATARSRCSGIGMPDGPLSAATGQLIEVKHSGCYRAARKREQRAAN